MKQASVKTIMAIGVLVTVLPSRVLATGIPTVDIANILQTTVTAFENIEQTVTMIEQLESAVQQYQQQIAHLETMTGTRGMGALLSSIQKSQDRRWAPSDLKSTMATIRAGGIPGTNQSYRVAAERYRDAAGAQTSSELSMASNGNIAYQSSYYDETRASNLAAIGLSEAAYTDTDRRTGEIEGLLSQVDIAPDQKAALDLMNTMIAQMLFLQNESLRLQAQMLQNTASANMNYTQMTAQEAKFHDRGNTP